MFALRISQQKIYKLLGYNKVQRIIVNYIRIICDTAMSSTVEVVEGKLQGKECTNANGVKYFSFKSIPYAKPPVGDLRFAAPSPPEPWEGIRDATKDCNISPQFDRDTNRVVGDEDCLYLNVYTPNLPNETDQLRPVMFFIHGGGFVFGNGTDDSTHGPDFLIEKDVVLISFNYRLGILGFLCLDRKEIPGNMGLKDQVQALKWVQANIAKFGGDPNNVTIFGISAGGASVEYLMLSPSAKGLFHKAIAQSGSSMVHWASNMDIKSLVKGKIINDDNELCKYLKNMSVKDLIATSMLAIATAVHGGSINFCFVPTVEKSGEWETFLEESPQTLLKQGRFAKVPYIAGFCTKEGLLAEVSPSQPLEKLFKEKNFLKYLPFNVDEDEKPELLNRMKSIYMEGDNLYDEPDFFAVDFFTDVDFLGGIYYATKLIAKNNPSVYFYEFSYDGALNYLKKKRNITRKGACHGDDGGYIIWSKLLANENLSDTDKTVRDRMVDMWTSFAKSGDPTPKINNLITTKWEAISETGVPCLKISENLEIKYEVYPERMKLFEDLFNKQCRD